MKAQYFKIFFIVIIFGLCGWCYKTYYEKSTQFQKFIEKNKVSESLEDNVQICAQADSTACSTNSDCNSGNCYAGICEPCEPTGMACTNDGNCCKANCSDGFCGGEDEWVPIYAGVASLGTAIGVGTAGLAGRIGFNYSAYVTQEGDLDTAELEQDMDDIINSERVEGLEADMEYAEENPEVVQVTAEDDEAYLEENSAEVSEYWDEYQSEFENDLIDNEAEIEADLEMAGEDFAAVEENPAVDEMEVEMFLAVDEDAA
ncbi:MAG: hypothetical protein ACXWL5_04185 [Candidatus Chromulinivorax sp.]